MRERYFFYVTSACSANQENFSLPCVLNQLLYLSDVSFHCSPAKNKWRSIVSSYFRKTQRKTIRKIDFPFLLHTLFGTSFSSASVSGGFKRAGVWPFSEDAAKEKVMRSGPLNTSHSATT